MRIEYIVEEEEGWDVVELGGEEGYGWIDKLGDWIIDKSHCSESLMWTWNGQTYAHELRRRAYSRWWLFVVVGLKW
jgi:hypothetical protein